MQEGRTACGSIETIPLTSNVNRDIGERERNGDGGCCAERGQREIFIAIASPAGVRAGKSDVCKGEITSCGTK